MRSLDPTDPAYVDTLIVDVSHVPHRPTRRTVRIANSTMSALIYGSPPAISPLDVPLGLALDDDLIPVEVVLPARSRTRTTLIPATTLAELVDATRPLDLDRARTRVLPRDRTRVMSREEVARLVMTAAPTDGRVLALIATVKQAARRAARGTR